MARTRSAKPRLMHSQGFGLLGETLLVGLVVVICLLPAVTALAGVAAGARHLKRHIAGEGDGFRLLLDDLRAALRALLLPGAVLVAAILMLMFDLWLLSFVHVPGKPAVVVVLLVACVLATVIAVRWAARWTPGDRWRASLRDAARVSRRDPSGTLLLACALGASVVFVWMYPPLLVVAGGLVVLAGVGVEVRRATRAESASAG